MMELKGQQIRYFLFSQYLADGVRTTIEIVLPVIICTLFGQVEMGYTIALGALCVSASDAPGPVEHKRNGMMYCNIAVFLMALLTGFANNNVVLMGLLIAGASFFFTMFSIYGNRAASIGTAALLVMILRMSTKVTPLEVLQDSLLILAGGTWYMVIALLLFSVTPYRPGQRALGDCIYETAKFLKIKATFYEDRSLIKENYRRLVTQQVIVSDKQDALRELLYKNRDLIEESSKKGKLLVLTFADLMDLYEHISAIWYDYESLHEKFEHTGILRDIGEVIRTMAGELENVGLAIQSNISITTRYDIIEALNKIKVQVDALGESDPGSLVLKKILVNMRNISRQVDELFNYFKAGKKNRRSLESGNYYSSFVSHQQIDLSLFRDNLHIESSVFRHSMRMMITCLAGFIIAKMLAYGDYSYWVLLTIIIILKPGFALTKERNVQRITGTVAGGIIGIVLLAFIEDRTILFILLIACMVGTYTFQRLNYITMVIFTTPYILILFHLLGLPFWDVARERLLDTGIGCTLGLMASYMLFPEWESRQLQSYMNRVLQANIRYLQKLKEMLAGMDIPQLEYKLARKELYVSVANLSAAFHRMLNDPKNKQQNRQYIDEFVVMNHIFSSNIVSLSASARETEPKQYPKEIMVKIKKAMLTMEDTLRILDPGYQPGMQPGVMVTDPNISTGSHHQLSNQLDFINKIALDIQRVTKQTFGK